MDKNTKKILAHLSFIGVTIGLGLYTQNVEWNPIIRTMVHFTGAAVIPGYTSVIGSITHEGINELQNKFSAKNKEKNLSKTILLEKQKQLEKDNAKSKSSRGLTIASIIGAVTYLGFSYLWERYQFSQSGILEPFQYLMDTTGIAFGLTTMSGIDGRPAIAKINQMEDKVKQRIRKSLGRDTEHEKSIDKDQQRDSIIDKSLNCSKEKENKLIEYLHGFENRNDNNNKEYNNYRNNETNTIKQNTKEGSIQDYDIEN